MNNTATRKRPKQAPAADSKQLLIELSDLAGGRLVWEDGSVSTFNPASVLGKKLALALKRVRLKPKKAVTVKAIPVTRSWGWVNGRWTVTNIV